jgi:3-phenylpropionate/trans-cinnamate dioxygenase ferredoxin reductase subunit
MPARVVIVGAGQAGFQAAAALRAEGFDGHIALVGEEPEIPYQRPPLSKAFLLGKQEARHAFLRPAAFYPANRVELRTSERVTEVDRAAARVRLASGASLPYDALILATGARNRVLPVPGGSSDRVGYLRTMAEAVSLRERLVAARSVAIVGGGFIGLEVAAAARILGKSVAVVEALPRLMTRAVAPLVSECVRATHAAQGVDVLLGASVREISGDALVLADGRKLHADLVVAGIGVAPNVELARDAGLEVANGIAVDQRLQTSAENIFAIGDCAGFPSALTGARVRLESVQNAVDQAACVARILAGKPGTYQAVPWFWTDQFDLRLQMAGLGAGWDQLVLRGTPESRRFSVFYFAGTVLRAVDSVNRPADHLAARKLLAARASITPEQAGDTNCDLNALLDGGPVPKSSLSTL